MEFQRLRDDFAAGEIFALRRHSDSAKDLDGELNLDVTHEVGRIDRAMGLERLQLGTLPAPDGIVQPPEEERDGELFPPEPDGRHEV